MHTCGNTFSPDLINSCVAIRWGSIYRPLAPRWSIGHPQLSSTVLSEVVVQSGSIAGLFAAVFLRLIFSNCFSAYHGFVYLEDSKTECLFSYVVIFNVWRIHFPSFVLIWVVIFSSWVFASRSSLLMAFGHLTQGCYIGSDLWRLGFLPRFSSLLSKFRLHTSRASLHL